MFLLLFLFLIAPQLLNAQPSVELHQAFLDLRHDGVLMNVAAHPDDEDGATLAYYRMKFGVKTYSVIFTRGEGGQNEKGPELYEELGVLRTQETLEAAKILGSDVRFLNLMDFGFSKTATEAFQKWGGRREVLRRLVYFIRKLKPDVIFTNHNTIEGHGHHQAVAITAIAAFDAAADSTFFPEQLQEPGVVLWQPRKLFFRNFSRLDQSADVVNNIDELDSARNLSYLDIASNALRMHKTQGLDRANLRAFTRGLSIYKLMRASSLYDRDSTSFFSGIDLWSDPALAKLVPLRAELSTLHEGMAADSLIRDAAHLLQTINTLQQEKLSSALAGRVLVRWEDEVEDLASFTCGLKVSFDLKDRVIVAKQKVACTLEVSSDECTLSGVKDWVNVPEGWSINETVGSAPEITPHRLLKDLTLIVGDNPTLTLPKAVAQYTLIDVDQHIGVTVSYSVNGNRLSQSFRPDFEVAPGQTLSIEPEIARISPARIRNGKAFKFTVKNYLPHKSAGTVRVVTPPGWRAEFPTFAIGSEDSTASGQVFVLPPDTVKQGDYALRFKTDYASDDVVVKVFDVAVAKGLRVGIIKSYDTTLESALEELGVQYKALDSKDLEQGDLSRYNSIVIDIRAYLVREDLKTHNARLLDYVKAGGNLVVMYQRDQEWKPEYAPFPFQISRKRVTVEEAPIVVLQPHHPLLTQPNTIGGDAWLGWKQERALYFPTNVASEYVQLLSTHDPDEPPLNTGYLVATAGSGSYIYTSYVWYRQLKEMHRGAFACFANMISYPQYRLQNKSTTR
jgi:LmbE family N-acetylglucosaminyl deacetylase